MTLFDCNSNPHRSVRADFPHTALPTGSPDRRINPRVALVDSRFRERVMAVEFKEFYPGKAFPLAPSIQPFKPQPSDHIVELV